MGTILVVDDEAEFLMQASSLLREKYRRGMRVETAESPEEALIRIRSSAFGYDMVLTDLLFRNSLNNGIWLIEQIQAIRERRGYDPAPIAIGLTVEKSFKNAKTYNDIRERGGSFVSKLDPDLYLAAIDTALQNLQEQRIGPHIIFDHKVSGDPSLKTLLPHKREKCSANERLVSARIFNENDPDDGLIGGGIRPLLILDLLAHPIRYQRKLSIPDMISFMYNDEFYKAQLAEDLPFKNPEKVVQMNLNRIRTNLRHALKNRFDIEKVLITEYFDFVDGEPVDDPEMVQLLHERNRGGTRRVGVRLPKVTARYHLRARRSVRHI